MRFRKFFKKILDAKARFSYIIEIMKSELDTQVLTCVYCGKEYPQGTPSWGDKILTEHIRVCEKHPMRKLEEEKQKLRSALLRVVLGRRLKTLEEAEKAVNESTYDNDFLNLVKDCIKVLRETE